MKKTSILLLAILFCHFPNVIGQTFKGNGFQQFKIGDIEAIVLSDGYGAFTSVQPVMAPDINSKLVSDLLLQHYQSDKELNLAMNILLLKKDDRLILFDAGGGKGADPNTGWLVDNLSVIGIEPEQITDIVVSHGHLDHIGGLIDAQGKSVFPNAVIYISRIEYEFLTNGIPDISKSKFEDKVMFKSMFEMIKQVLSGEIKSQFKFLEDKSTLLDCIKIEIAPGHTDGHYISTISSKGESLIHIADIIHSATLLFAHPEWGTSFDSNFDLGVKTRINVLRRVHNDKALIMGYHLPYPGIGHIKSIGKDSYDWVPRSFATPQIK